MTRDAIITLPHPHLRHKSAKVSAVTSDIVQLIADMRSAALDWEENRPHELGVALAAVQVDRLTRLVIIRNNFDDKDDRTFVTLINPEIIKRDGELTYDHEGCLSVPDIYGLVPRYDRVRVKALDEHGTAVRLKANGFLARILQHEIDHTNGVMFIDHIKDKDAFFTLTEEGKLVKVPHESVLNNRILW